MELLVVGEGVEVGKIESKINPESGENEHLDLNRGYKSVWHKKYEVVHRRNLERRGQRQSLFSEVSLMSNKYHVFYPSLQFQQPRVDLYFSYQTSSFPPTSDRLTLTAFDSQVVSPRILH